MMAVTSDLGSPILLRIISKERTEKYIAQFVLSLETQIFSLKQLFLKTLLSKNIISFFWQFPKVYR